MQSLPQIDHIPWLSDEWGKPNAGLGDIRGESSAVLDAISGQFDPEDEVLLSELAGQLLKVASAVFLFNIGQVFCKLNLNGEFDKVKIQKPRGEKINCAKNLT